MKQPVRTKWHKLVSLVQEDQVYLTAPKGGTAKHWEELKANKKAGKWFVDQLTPLPKFVVQPELLEMVMTEGYDHSILAMRKANVFRLPFTAMLVEFIYSGKHYIILLRDQQDKEVRMPWEAPRPAEPSEEEERFRSLPMYGMVFQLQNDGEGDYLVMGPSVCGIDIQEIDSKPYIGLTAQGLEILPNSPELNELVKATWQKDAGAVFRGLASALLIMQTEGVEKEVIDCAKLNKKRVLSNKPLIPRHVYLKIGRVYKSGSDHSEEYNPRKSPRIHWRRGHERRVHYGTGREKVKLMYIPPRIVGYKDGDTQPAFPTYIATK
jgi:hypothetical protein